MAHVAVRADLDLDAPTLVEGLPGVGLVGKIAADHLVETLDMTYYAGVYCEGLPKVAVYRSEGADVVPPVRLYADAGRDLLVLQSDVPVSPGNATEFATCLTGWFDEHDATPVFLSGLPTDGSDRASGGQSGSPLTGDQQTGDDAGTGTDGDEAEVYGVATGEGHALLEGAGIAGPDEGGYVSGPTGALLARAEEVDLTAVGLIVPADPRFPDPEAARRLLDDGVERLVDVDVDTAPLSEDAEQIREARERLARRMQQADDSSSQAQPIRGFQ